MPNIAVSTSGGLKYIFTQKRAGLCIRNASAGRFRDRSVIFPDIRGGFDAATDQNGGIVIICQDRERNLVCLREGADGFSKEYLLKARAGNSIDISDFRLIGVNALMTAFYRISYGGKAMLCIQTLNGGTTPEPIDYIDGKHREFEVCKASNNDIHIFYTQEGTGFGERIYKWSQKRFDDFTLISERADKAAAFDYGGIHLCTASAGGIFYRRLPEFDAQWEDAKLLTKQSGEVKSCAVFEKNERLNIMWEGADRLYAASASGGGWSRVREFTAPQGFLCERIKLINGRAEMFAYAYISNSRIILPVGRAFINSKPRREMKYDLDIRPAGNPPTKPPIPPEAVKNEIPKIRREDFEVQPDVQPARTAPSQNAPTQEREIVRPSDLYAIDRLADSIENLASAMRENAGFTRSHTPKIKPNRRKYVPLSTMHKKIN